MDTKDIKDTKDKMYRSFLCVLCVDSTVIWIQTLRCPGFSVDAVLQRVGRADLERDERVAVARLSELPEAHAVRIRRGNLHVLDDLVPADELVVVAHFVPETLLRGLEHAGRGRDECRRGCEGE